MPDLKLGKLPDRTPAKITITVSSDLNQALQQYAVLYRLHYGEDEPAAELIPYMLEAFLDSDREFSKARKNGVIATGRDQFGRSPSQASATGATITPKGS